MTTEAPPEPETQVAGNEPADVDEAAKTPSQMFRYAGWVHLGPQAPDCPDVNEDEGKNECGNPLHFHAWCRLPNQFQHREIREKALAAKARKARMLHDPESDAFVILEDSLDQIARQGDDAIPLLVEELLGRDWWADYVEAARDVQELEEGTDGDGEPIRPFARVERDQERHSELEVMSEEERPNDEYAELIRHLARYAAAVKERQEEIVKPRRDALTEKGINGLVDLVRDQRVNAAGTEEFMHTYSTWSWLVGTLRRPGGPTVWPADPRALVNVAPEVLEEVKATFEDLEQTRDRGLEGNA